MFLSKLRTMDAVLATVLQQEQMVRPAADVVLKTCACGRSNSEANLKLLLRRKAQTWTSHSLEPESKACSCLSDRGANKVEWDLDPSDERKRINSNRDS